MQATGGAPEVPEQPSATANGGAGPDTTPPAGPEGGGPTADVDAGPAANAPLGTPMEQALTALPAARQEHCVAAAKGKVYVLGGYAPQVTDSVLAYDPATKAWTDAQSFPEPMNHCQVGVINDVMYVAGYYINGTMSTATDKAYSYDPDADEWVSISPLPSGTDRAAGCVAVTDGLMYVVGGAHDGTSVDDVARYDPVSDSWETLPNLPERREHCAAGAIDGIVYVAGGRADGITGIEEKTWAYDPAA
ncbi:MAG TPA: kelch repeat-containing protein, partial [Polyangiaceae bacterium]|nr:kelch repeat-containing protein [Polyangiaceae bacterium]